MQANALYTAFAGVTHLVTGDLRTMITGVREYLQREKQDPVLIFDDQTGKQVDFNFQGTLEQVLARVLPPSPKKGPGRPNLGVVSREVSLLPRHWDWLERQPQKASGTLRRLVESAMKSESQEDRSRRRLEAAGRFMWSMAGNLEGFEEASRALYAGNGAGFAERIASWPADIRQHLERMVQQAGDPAGNSRPCGQYTSSST